MAHLKNSVLHDNIWSRDWLQDSCNQCLILMDPTAEARLTWLTFTPHCSVAATKGLETCTYFSCNCPKKSSLELVRLHGPIGYARFATKDLESMIRNNPCQTYLLQSPAEKWGETEGSRQSTTFIVGILLTSFDLNCSLEAKPTLVSFILLKSQT